jgi:hypothetical protein
MNALDTDNFKRWPFWCQSAKNEGFGPRDRRLFKTDRRAHHLGGGFEISMESLILAQDERWRRA